MATTLEPIMKGATAILRNAELDPLTDRQLKTFAPTIFASGGIAGVEGVKDVSNKYGFINSKMIIDAMRDDGFDPVEVRYSKRRNEEKQPWTKHMIKFRQQGVLKKQQVGDVISQVVMLNSHDRSSGFHLYPGLFRLVCSNGLMVSESAIVEPIKILHSARMVENILERSKELIKGADGVYTLREQMLKTPMNEKQALAFAMSAMEFRPPRRVAAPDPKALLMPRRKEDDKPNLWHVFNRVQENMLNGGLTMTTGAGKELHTRGIGRIERDVQVNSDLWSLAVLTIAKAAASAKRATAKKTAVAEAE